MLNHKAFEALLRKACVDHIGPAARGVRLPTSRDLEISGSQEAPTLRLRTAVAANMQKDAAAFEGWALALLVWGEARCVALDWDAPDLSAPSARQHYQRFLYRVLRFEEIIGRDRLTVLDRERLEGLQLTQENCRTTLTVPGGIDTADVPSAAQSEAELEKLFTRAHSPARLRLMSDLNLRSLDRQFPVGVYDGPPRKATAIFTGGKSAIDLIGTGHDGTLWLFELKGAKNVKLGALSELLFYSALVDDVRLGRIAFAEGGWGKRVAIQPSDITAATRIEARLLVDREHPLISADMLDLLNQGAAKAGLPIRYGVLRTRRYLSPDSDAQEA